jgi:Phasin protein
MLRGHYTKVYTRSITEDGPRMIYQGDSMIDLAPVQEKLTAIVTTQTDYAKASFEANKAYFEKLATLKAPDQAMQLTTDHMKSAYETFVAESKKIGEMYKTFFATAFTPTSV